MTNTKPIAEPRAPASRQVVRATPLGALILVLLVPKCPLCVVVMLTALGFAAGESRWLAPWVRPGTFLVAAAAVALVVGGEVRRRRGRACCRKDS